MTRPLRSCVLAAVLLASACGDGRAADQEPTPAPDALPDGDDSAADQSGLDPSADTTTTVASVWPVDLQRIESSAPQSWTVEIVDTYPHDETAFTQGLELVSEGTLLESTGLRGFSSIRLVDLASGTVAASADLDQAEFGEGATRVGDTVVQLTWQEHVARRWQLPDLEPLAPFTYDGEGWGLCSDGDRLAMTDGTSELEWRDPESFAVLDTVAVRLGDALITDLNEIECIDGFVIANVWRTQYLVVIRDDGAVLATIDASDLVTRTAVEFPGSDVLNGVADLGDGTLLLGGKRWPVFYRVRLVAG